MVKGIGVSKVIYEGRGQDLLKEMLRIAQYVIIYNKNI
jgi:hypothetical protein